MNSLLRSTNFSCFDVLLCEIKFFFLLKSRHTHNTIYIFMSSEGNRIDAENQSFNGISIYACDFIGFYQHRNCKKGAIQFHPNSDQLWRCVHICNLTIFSMEPNAIHLFPNLMNFLAILLKIPITICNLLTV